MKFSIKRDLLLQPIQLVSGAVERRNHLPILSNFLLDVSEQNLRMTGTDLEVELTGSVSLSGAVRAGKTTVPAKKFLDIVRSLPENADVTIEQVDTKLFVKSGRSRFSLVTLSADNYPNSESLNPEIEFNVSPSSLKSLIDQTQFAMANQDARYYLNGLMLEIEGSLLRAVSTDGHRLALSHCFIDTNLQRKQIILPRKGVAELLRLLDIDEEKLTLVIGDSSLRVQTGDALLTCKLIDGRFPDYNRVLPKGGDKVVLAERDKLRQCLLRASILSNEKFRGIRFQLESGVVKITANNPEQEEAEEFLDVEYQGEAIEIGFNVSYLLDVLNVIQTPQIKLTFIDSQSSVLIESDDEIEAMYVVMPMRL